MRKMEAKTEEIALGQGKDDDANPVGRYPSDSSIGMMDLDCSSSEEEDDQSATPHLVEMKSEPVVSCNNVGNCTTKPTYSPKRATSQGSRSSAARSRLVRSPIRGDRRGTNSSGAMRPRNRSLPSLLGNESESSDHTSASERSGKIKRVSSRPHVTCAPERPPRLGGLREAKSVSNLMATDSTGNIRSSIGDASTTKRQGSCSGSWNTTVDQNQQATLDSDSMMHEDDHSVNSTATFHSRHSGFYPIESITADNLERLSLMDLSISVQDNPYSTRRRLSGRDANHSSTISLLDDAFLPLSNDTPWATFTRNITYIGSVVSASTFGRNLNVIADMMTGKREVLDTIDEDSEEILNDYVHQQKQQEHELATYLKNGTNGFHNIVSHEGKAKKNGSE